MAPLVKVEALGTASWRPGSALLRLGDPWQDAGLARVPRSPSSSGGCPSRRIRDRPRAALHGGDLAVNVLGITSTFASVLRGSAGWRLRIELGVLRLTSTPAPTRPARQRLGDVDGSPAARPVRCSRCSPARRARSSFEDGAILFFLVVRAPKRSSASAPGECGPLLRASCSSAPCVTAAW